jgi:peptidylprolyl isomerase
MFKSRKIVSGFAALIASIVLSACSPASSTPSTDDGTKAALAAQSVNGSSTSRCIGVQPDPNEKVPTDGKTKTWSKPDIVTFGDRIYCAILTTNQGRIVIELFPKVAPQNVNNFVFLAKQGFYENITWHRVLSGKLAQSGDPTGTGTGGPGYVIPLEANPNLKYDREGRVGVARTTEPNSAGSQWFISLAPLSNLDVAPGNPGYSIIGQVVEGLNVLRQITPRDPSADPNAAPGDPLISIRIVELQ